MSDPSNEDPYSSKSWNRLRASFQNSLLVDTPLKSLAESLDIRSWPIEGDNETPAKYIEYEYEDLSKLPEVKENPECVDLLMDILEGTLAFDDPFGDMVETEESNAHGDNEVIKNLKRLDISPEFPISLANLPDESVDLCRSQDITNLSEFAEFSQNMAQHIVLGGDFRELLNALTHVNEAVIARYLPFRPGSKGLHVPEAVGLLIDQLESDERLSLLEKCGGELTRDEKARVRILPAERRKELEQDFERRLKEIFDWFSADKQEFREALAGHRQLDRYFVAINDPAKELIAARLVAGYLKKSMPPEEPPGTEETVTESESAPAAGLIGKLAGLFRRFRRE